MRVKKLGHMMFKFFKGIVMFLGMISLFFIILSFTDQPYMMYHWLGTHNSKINSKPDYIVIMGAGGMPGPEGLIRCYYAGKAAKKYPNSKLIIALPSDKDAFFQSDLYRMFNEIKNSGVDSTRFLFEKIGTNTHEQSREIYGLLKDEKNKNLLIVTSPEHMHRCILTFQKSGFESVCGLPTFENSFNEELLFSKEERSEKIKDLHRNLNIRYNMWTYLKYEITILREFIAIGWYKFKGYI